MLPLAKNIKRYFSMKELGLVVLAIAIAVAGGVGVYMNLSREVVINDNGAVLTVKTMNSTVGEVLAQNGIKVEPYDYISVSPDKKLQKIGTNEVYIKRAVPVKITVDGQEKTYMTYRDTVKEALEGAAIPVGELDRLDGASLDQPIARDMAFRLIKVNEEVVNEQSSIPFEVVKRDNNKLDKGTEKVVKEGKDGILEKSFKVVLEDGKEVARNLINETIISNPINKLIDIGTVSVFKTSRGESVRYRKVLDMRATAYTSSYKDTGKNPGDAGFGITYTGMTAKVGVIAVDPKVIPLRSRLYVECIGRNDYGFAVAGDVGSAIKGNKVDLYFDDQKTVDAWGVKNVRVYVLAE